MKNIYVAIFLGAVVILSGCNQGTSGGPGASAPAAEKPMGGQAEETFSLDMPMLSTKLNQGETAVVSIGIKRGNNMDGDIALKFAGLPGGVTIEPANPSIKREDMDAELTFRAAEDASLGDFTITVLGHPEKGRDASNDLNITVAKSALTEAGNAETEAGNAVEQAAEATRDEYTRETQRLLNELDTKYDELVARTDKAEGEAKKELELKLARAEEKRNVAAQRLDELQAASTDRWDQIREGVENAFADLKTIFE